MFNANLMLVDRNRPFKRLHPQRNPFLPFALILFLHAVSLALTIVDPSPRSEYLFFSLCIKAAIKRGGPFLCFDRDPLMPLAASVKEGSKKGRNLASSRPI